VVGEFALSEPKNVTLGSGSDLSIDQSIQRGILLGLGRLHLSGTIQLWHLSLRSFVLSDFNLCISHTLTQPSWTIEKAEETMQHQHLDDIGLIEMVE